MAIIIINFFIFYYTVLEYYYRVLFDPRHKTVIMIMMFQNNYAFVFYKRLPYTVIIIYESFNNGTKGQ